MNKNHLKHLNEFEDLNYTRMDNKIKKTAIAAAKKAGKFALGEYKNFDRRTIKLKTRHDIVTKADLASEKIIINTIKKNFPEHRILSEEAGQTKNKSDYLWIIDPIDGTTNFSMHNPLWSISIALAFKQEIVLGVIYAPCPDELFIAEKGKGVKLNNKKIKVSKVKAGKVLNAFCHSSRKKDIQKAIKYFSYQKLHGLDCRQMGSAAIELAYIACGRIESIVIPGANSWDVAAGALMVREAGGIVTDFSGNPWKIDSADIAASNGLAHKDILNIIKRI
ncbi:inositol monophosphatase [Patescibacteria group bacterium]|nr:inositol monophosphatase [Candidatus Falkowbacteria bacterium]MBU4026272.1 inositol monophosphatase [Patescibacteria group bacterium]MBU4073058.1 inositol monophosphatase [Patescibacteria group bacterium]MBU4125164.1 inositol monophosphatase [Patescibacteria group bacterium]